MFTFVIHGDDYDLLKYEESISQVTSQATWTKHTLYKN